MFNYNKLSLILLLNTLLVCLTLGMLNPFLIPEFSAKTSISPVKISELLFYSLAAGSLISFILVIYSKNKFISYLGWGGYLISSLSIFTMYKIDSESAILTVFISLFMLRLALSLTYNVDRILHVELNPRKDTTKLFSYSSAAAGLGTALGPIIGGTLISSYNFNTCLMVAFGISIINVIVFSILISRKIISDDKKSSEKFIFWDIRLLLFISFGMCAFSYIGQTFSFIPLTLKSVHGDNYNSFVTVFFTINACVLLLSPIIVIFFRKIHPCLINLSTFGIVLMSLSLIILTLYQSYLFVSLSAILLSVGESLTYVFLIEYLKESFGSKNFKNNIVLFNFSTMFVGIGFGQYLGSVIGESVSTSNIVSFWIVFAVIGYIFGSLTKKFERIQV